ncbi:ANTAR domain-containing response regulator [Geomesophilobacter sediminis]|uniref:Response regulator n=1 Tax=Geomesophilobacter sediminis TaxID=2798584 RepID=A0A8J7JJ19_9BACT|nr:response regulator [Geomesophilobacter sediminis]MBJ6724485.1 response regulator [Geomesophilobacter sediminis]
MKSVLIGDAHPAVRSGLAETLGSFGFDKVCECSDGRSAVTMAASTPPDIAILDAALPKLDGLSASREIRKKLGIPILLLTERCDYDTLRKAKAAGVTSILVKPLRHKDILPAIEMAFAHAEEVEILKESVRDLNETVVSRNLIEKAKAILYRAQGLYPYEAFRFIRKVARDKKTSMRRIAEAVLITEGL